MVVPIRRAERRVVALSAPLYASYNTSLPPLFFHLLFVVKNSIDVKGTPYIVDKWVRSSYPYTSHLHQIPILLSPIPH
uniref:Uncharacterized protein n=1 Tax=Gossypium raimondii TaxID=29730 RepID=A0A0D2P6M4_GOSRA|nr:hypothetical protein B456_007G101900 [Gossypium raimondii]